MKTYKEDRPWGVFFQFTHNEPSTVKIIEVHPQQELSLQYHNKREEFWRVLSGTPVLTIGDEVVQATVGQEFTIPVGTKHRIATSTSPAIILEISTGEFDEDDIVRLEDKYGRV